MLLETMFNASACVRRAAQIMTFMCMRSGLSSPDSALQQEQQQQW